MSEFNDFLEGVFGKGKVVIIIICILIALYLIMGLIFNFFPFSLFKKVVNTDNIIYSYEWFYDQYNAIQAQKVNVLNIPHDAPEYNGMVIVLNNAIAKYNSESSKITKNGWKPNDIPHRIDFMEVEK